MLMAKLACIYKPVNPDWEGTALAGVCKPGAGSARALTLLLNSTLSPASSAADGANQLELLAGGLRTRHCLGLEVSGGLARQHRLLLQQGAAPTAPRACPARLSAGTGSNRLQRKGNCPSRTG